MIFCSLIQAKIIEDQFFFFDSEADGRPDLSLKITEKIEWRTTITTALNMKLCNLDNKKITKVIPSRKSLRGLIGFSFFLLKKSFKLFIVGSPNNLKPLPGPFQKTSWGYSSLALKRRHLFISSLLHYVICTNRAPQQAVYRDYFEAPSGLEEKPGLIDQRDKRPSIWNCGPKLRWRGLR